MGSYVCCGARPDTGGPEYKQEHVQHFLITKRFHFLQDYLVTDSDSIVVNKGMTTVRLTWQALQSQLGFTVFSNVRLCLTGSPAVQQLAGELFNVVKHTGEVVDWPELKLFHRITVLNNDAELPAMSARHNAVACSITSCIPVLPNHRYVCTVCSLLPLWVFED